MAKALALFEIMIYVQLFYAFGISVYTHTLPSDTLNHLSIFNDIGEPIDLQEIGTQLESSLTRQTNIPVVEIGALVFYSGNIVIDMLLNFAFAIPQMFTMLLTGLMYLFSLPTTLITLVQIFSTVLIMALYVFSIIQLLLGIRSGQIGA